MDNQIQEKDDIAIDLISGENYIIFNNLKNKIVIWVNCDKEMAVKMSKDDFIKSSKTLFPFLNISEILYYIYRGDYVYTDKKVIKPLRSSTIDNISLLPTLKEISALKNKNTFKFL